MKTTNRPELSFDGFGINGPDEYRTRLCTFSKGVSEDDRKKYGPLLASAPELLEALKRLLELCENGEGSDMYGIEGAHKAIAIAEGK